MSFEIRYIPNDDNENEVYICRESMPQDYGTFLDVFHKFLAGCGYDKLIRDDKDCSCNGDCLDDMVTINVPILEKRFMGYEYGKCDSIVKTYIDHLEKRIGELEQCLQEQDEDGNIVEGE